MYFGCRFHVLSFYELAFNHVLWPVHIQLFENHSQVITRSLHMKCLILLSNRPVPLKNLMNISHERFEAELIRLSLLKTQMCWISVFYEKCFLEENQLQENGDSCFKSAVVFTLLLYNIACEEYGLIDMFCSDMLTNKINKGHTD